MKLYLAVGSTHATVFGCLDAAHIDLRALGRVIGSPVELHELGIAHPDTPPGPLLHGDAADISRWRPLGKRVEI
jgi:hypothetical protein